MKPAAFFQSMLFVPGARPDRFAKALASGADLICIDLEDAVPADGKVEARKAAIAHLGDPRLALRINGLTTAAGLADLLSLSAAEKLPALLFVPMVEHAAEVAIIRGALGDRCPGIVPLVETAAGLLAAPAIAAERNVAALMFGGGDFSAELGVELAWEPLLFARSALAAAAAGARIPAIDVPWIQLDDEVGLEAESRRVKALGFSAKAAIHPAQIGGIHRAFRPTAEEVAEAHEALRAYEAAAGAAVRFKGRLLEAPIIHRYRKILALKELMNA